MSFRLVVILLLSTLAHAAEPEEWTYLDNGKLRLGVNRSGGAAIGWLSESGRDENVLNRFDLGRYVQQSWYGEKDGSDWNGQAWRWNPVQAGNWQNTPAKVTAFSATPATIAATTIPVHWATGKLLEEVLMNAKIELRDHLVRIEFSMHYTGVKTHPVQDQELPAVFVDAAYPNLRFFAPGDTEPRSLVPAWPNERYEIAQPWVAYTGANDRGIGVLVPGIETITCYRAEGDPNNRQKGACSYVAPVKQIAITPGFQHRYIVYLTLGTLPEIRHRFAEALKESGL